MKSTRRKYISLLLLLKELLKHVDKRSGFFFLSFVCLNLLMYVIFCHYKSLNLKRRVECRSSYIRNTIRNSSTPHLIYIFSEYIYGFFIVVFKRVWKKLGSPKKKKIWSSWRLKTHTQRKREIETKINSLSIIQRINAKKTTKGLLLNLPKRYAFIWTMEI